ncbi:MAG TPA: PadR family transcriptional regulator [Gemmatimonadaceae bacterium]|nr:PadR family transcriptional regulator [Gemmatimonadaceae bacterium]
MRATRPSNTALAAAQQLTELESCTLGVIRQCQPCSTYRVRSEFARSTTTAWSASAGAIYPVIERLVRAGYVRIRRRSTDSRGRRDLALTRRGARAVQDWIMQLEPSIARSTPDPIRSRVCFLDQLASDGDRQEFLTLAEQLTGLMISDLRAQERSTGDMTEIDRLVVIGSRLQLEARLAWLGIVRRRLGLPRTPTTAGRA